MTFWRLHYHGGLHSDIRAHRRRRKDVSSDGDDRRHRTNECAHIVDHVCASVCGAVFQEAC